MPCVTIVNVQMNDLELNSNLRMGDTLSRDGNVFLVLSVVLQIRRGKRDNFPFNSFKT